MADSPSLPTCKADLSASPAGSMPLPEGAHQRWGGLRRAAERHTETSCSRHDHVFVVGGMGVLLQHLDVTGLPPRTGAFDPAISYGRSSFARDP